MVIWQPSTDLKVPFLLDEDQRIDDTLVHEALREAFVYAIIHADCAGACSILVVNVLIYLSSGIPD